MSGSIDSIIANPQGVDVLGQIQRWQALKQAQAQTGLVGAQASQTQAQTGLIGAQAQGAGIANQLAGLNLERKAYQYDQAGLPVPAGMLGGSGAQPSSSSYSAPGAAGYLPGSNGSMPPSGSLGSVQTPQGAQQGFHGQMAEKMYGIPLPPMIALDIDGDPSKLKIAQENSRQTLFSTLGSAGDQLPQAVNSLVNAGWLDPTRAQNLLTDPSALPRFMSVLQTPESYQSALTALRSRNMQLDQNGQPVVMPQGVAATGATSTAQAGGAATYGKTEVTVPDPSVPGGFRVQTIQTSQLPSFMSANQGAKPTTAADLANPNTPLSGDAWANRVGGAESGNNPAAGSPTAGTGSNATGAAQFTPSTWLQTVRQARPDLAKYPDSTVLAWRTDASPAGQQLQTDMTKSYGQQNAATLAQGGLPVNSLTLGLAHRFGANGVQQILAAPANTPIASVTSPQVMAANPDLKGQTVGSVMGNTFKAYGMNPVNFNAGGAQSGATQGSPQPAAPSAQAAAQPAAVLGGGIPGPPVLTPAQAAGLPVAAKRLSDDQDAVNTSLTAANQAQVQQQNLTQFRDIASGLRTGAGSENRQSLQNFVSTYAPDFVQKLTKSLSAGVIDPTEAAQWQLMAKQALLTYGQAQQAVNPAGGLGVAQMYQNGFPNWDTQPTAVRDATNIMLVSQQRMIDQAQGQQQFMNTQLPAAQNDPRSYKPLQNYNAEFLKTNPPGVYVGAAAALNGKPYGEWSRGLSVPQQAQALTTMWKADPTAVVMDRQGRLRHNPALAQASQ